MNLLLLGLVSLWLGTNGLLLAEMSVPIQQKSIVVIIPSYNNAYWYKQNLDSVFKQKYDNYRVLYIDDCSTDKTHALVKNYIDQHKWHDKVTLLCNSERHGALYNLYHAIHSCNDWDIVVTLDGDDALAHDHVLSYLNQMYHDQNVWLTYGQFIEYPSQRIGFCAPFPAEVITNNSFRKFGCPVSHVRTFYAWLFKKIKKEHLLYKGDFFPMTWDKAMMLPMLEMCGGKFMFVSDVLYVYNFVNPLNDCKINGELQAHLARIILSMEPYQPLMDDEIPWEIMPIE